MASKGKGFQSKPKRKEKVIIPAQELLNQCKKWLKAESHKNKDCRLEDFAKVVDITMKTANRSIGRINFSRMWLEANPNASATIKAKHKAKVAELSNYLGDFEQRLEAYLMQHHKGEIVLEWKISNDLQIPQDILKDDFGAVRFAQVWLRCNPEAEGEAKEHYALIVKREMHDAEKDVTLEFKTANEGKKKVTITKTELQRTVKNYVEHAKEGEKSKVIGRAVSTELVVKKADVDPDEATIDRIRELYVSAPVGEMPSIRAIMIDVGLLADNGKPLGELTEAKVRQKMLEENWRKDRNDWIWQYMDIIPDEVKLTTLMRTIEVQKILYNQIKILNRQNSEYAAKGFVTTLDGKNIIKGFVPDPVAVGSLAEVMRRITSGNEAAIQINFHGGQGAVKGRSDGSLEVETSDGTLTLVNRRYVNTISTMSEQDIEKEIERLDGLSDLLTHENNVVSAIYDDDENGVLDVESEPVKPDNDNIIVELGEPL